MAADKGIDSLEEDKACAIVPATFVPAGNRLIGSRWVHERSAGLSYKARVVVQGQGQISDVDRGSTFAPVCRTHIIRMVLAAAVDYNHNTAFLNTTLEEEMHVKMAPGSEEYEPNVTLTITWLHKTLYGLRQSPNHGPLENNASACSVAGYRKGRITEITRPWKNMKGVQWAEKARSGGWFRTLSRCKRGWWSLVREAQLW